MKRNRRNQKKGISLLLSFVLVMTMLMPSWSFAENTTSVSPETVTEDSDIQQDTQQQEKAQEPQSDTNTVTKQETSQTNSVSTINDNVDSTVPDEVEEGYKFNITSNVETGKATNSNRLKGEYDTPYIYEKFSYDSNGNINDENVQRVYIVNYGDLTNKLKYIKINGTKIDVPERSYNYTSFPEIEGFKAYADHISGIRYGKGNGILTVQFGSNSTYSSDINIHFEFETTYQLAVVSDDSDKGEASYTATENKNEYKLTATPKEGYRFDYWSVDDKAVSYNSEYTVTLTENTEFKAHFIDENAGYRIRFTSNIETGTVTTSKHIDDTDKPYIYSNLKYDDEGNINVGNSQFIQIVNYDALDYELYIDINGTKIVYLPEQSGTKNIWTSFPEIKGFEASTIDISGMCWYKSGVFALRFYKNSTYNSDINIHFEFQKKTGPAFTATVVSGNSEQGTIEENAVEYVKNSADRTSTAWKVTANPAEGYQLAYIQAGNDESTRVYSEDGKTVTWEIKEDKAYTAYFETLTLKFGDHFWYAPGAGITANRGSATKANTSSAAVFTGQRAWFQFETIAAGEPVADSKVTYRIYAGNTTDEESLLGTYMFKLEHSATYYPKLLIDSMPQLSEITVTAQINDGEIVKNTYNNIVVKESGNTALNFLTAENSSLYPYFDAAKIKGPNVYDACTFVDEKTGALTMYIAASGGIMKYDGSGTADLTYMEGMEFAYNSSESNSGCPLAIGGATEDSLTAFVKGGVNNKNETEYSIYTCENGVWKKVENSGFEEKTEYKTGIVLGSDDVWITDKHWDGSQWADNDVSFNSFWKKNNSTAYAGSSDGIYKYEGGSWTKVDGTSGITYISGGCTASDGDVMITSDKWKVTGEITAYADMGTSINKVTIGEGSVAIVPVDVTYFSNMNASVYVAVNDSGEIYAITNGGTYTISEAFFGGGDYYGAMVYKLVNGSWQYQIVEEFNDENDKALLEDGKILGISYYEEDLSVSDEEKANLIGKYRPDGVTKIINALDKISLFVGKAGAVYAQFGETTITFDSQGGSEVAPITQTICSKVTAPESPTYGDYTFGGWYTRANCLSENLYTFGCMPAKDITLYAKWVEDGDSLQNIRAAALASLEKAYTSYQQSEYEDAAWNELENTYKAGKSGIKNAGTYDLIQSSLNSAMAAMATIEKSGEITVTVSVEKFSVDGTYIIEPTEVTVPRYTQASVVVTDLLKEFYKNSGTISNGYNGNPYRLGINATEKANFYLSGVYDPTFEADSSKGQKQGFEGFLSEFDCGSDSGWMYCVNGSFPGVGASAYTLSNGDVMRWQYTCKGYGADIGADNSSWGSGDSEGVADKDALTARIAEINKDKAAFFAQTPDGSNEAAYENAMKVLANIASTQEEVDNALKALGGKVATAEEKLAKAKASAKAELNGYDAELYRDAEKTLLVQYRQEGIAAIEAATTVDEVNKALKDAKSKIEALTTAAEYEAMESVADADTTKIYEQTGKYLNGLGTPGVGSTGGEWLTIGLSRADYDVSDEWSEGYYANAVDYVKKEIDKDTGRLHRVKSTDNSRLILALTATGRDVTDVGGYNLLTALADLDYLQKQGNNGPIWALIALDSHDYEIPEVQTEGTQATRENIIDTILKGRNSDGGWSLNRTESGSSDVDMTAMAIQALAPYYKDESHSKHAEVKAAVDKALALLSDMQKKTGGFDSWGTVNAESCAQVLTALTSLGINPEKDERFIKGDYSVIDALLSFAVDDKGFQHVAGGGLDGMATEQAYYALASYYRLLDGKTSLYDMSDVKIGEAYEPDVPVDKPDDSRQDDGKTDNTDGTSDKAASTKTAGGKTKSATKSANVKLSGNLTDAAQKVIDKIDALVANGASEDQISDILAAYKAYSELSAEEQLAVEKSDNFKAYSELCTKMGKEYHYDKATGTDMRDNSEEVLPWYIKVVVEPQELTKAQQKKVSGALGEESKIFTMHDINFINMLDGSTWHPEDAVKVKLPMVDIGEYESAIIVHITDDGKVELIEGSINGDTIEFAASSFSLYGIAGSMSSVDDLLAAQDTAAVWPWILAAAIALAAIIFIAVRRKNKNADSVTDFEDPEL